MKRQAKTVAAHAQSTGICWRNGGKRRNLSRDEALQIIQRMDTILERLPHAVKQAHERIIGEARWRTRALVTLIRRAWNLGSAVAR
jgi:hypothetical protein